MKLPDHMLSCFSITFHLMVLVTLLEVITTLRGVHRMLLKNNFVSCVVEKAFCIIFLWFLCLDEYVPDVSLTCYIVLTVSERNLL